MNQNIVNQYKISFQNRVDDWGNFGKEINKIINTNSEPLTNFLICWTSISEINESLLPDINEALTHPNVEVNSDSPPVDIVMSDNLVDFYGYEGYINSIPLQDLKEIVIAWRDFLNTPPLNGTKVDYFKLQ